MSRRLRKAAPVIMALSKSPRSIRNSVIESAPNELVDCICECAHNLLKGNVSLSPVQFKRLKRYRKQLRQLTAKQATRKEKRTILQKGGFLGIIAPIISSIAGALLGGGR